MVLTICRDGSSFTTHDERRYDVWGSVRAGSGASSQRYCANLGHQQDDESGLVYMRARYYQPGSGRFISQDPAMDGLNWYAYCGNDPINLVDESGTSAHAFVLLIYQTVAFSFCFALASGITAWSLTLANPSYRPSSFFDRTKSLAESLLGGVLVGLYADVKAASAGQLSLAELGKAISKSLKSLPGYVKTMAWSGAAKVGLIFGAYMALMDYFCSAAYSESMAGCFE